MAQAGKAAKFVPVADKLAMADAMRAIELHAIRGSPHAESFLLVYLPRRILIEADAFTPAAPNAPPQATPNLPSGARKGQRGAAVAALKSLLERAPERQNTRIGVGSVFSSSAKRAISSALCTFGATGSHSYARPAARAAASTLAEVG
jgi:hypothetical protein